MDMADALVIKRKLARLAQYLEELKLLSQITLQEYLNDQRHRRAVERLIQLVVDVAVDTNTHMIVDAGRPAPSDAYTSFIEAGALGALPADLARELAPSTGERNIIVHGYETIDDTIVYESMGQALDLYAKYIAAVVQYVERS